jgi:hypothetical protein
MNTENVCKRTFVFYHAGSNTAEPRMLVESILAVDSQATIIQCSDLLTQRIHGVTRVARFASDPENLMTARIQAFANLNLQFPALYLDTDMLMIGQCDLQSLSSTCDVLLCERNFDVDVPHSGEQRGIKYPEHAGRPLGEIYPYLACATVTRNSRFWAELVAEMDVLDSRFHRWYGDQEAMRIWVEKRGRTSVGLLPEAVYACLPDKAKYTGQEKILHFKGYKRKALMPRFHALLTGQR